MKGFVKGIILAAVIAPFFAASNAMYQVHFFQPANEGLQAGQCLMILGARSLPGGIPGLMMRERLATADGLLNEGYDKIIVTGGSLDEEKSEAQVMQEYLIAKGVPKESILVEDKSTSTLENMSFSKPLLADADCETVDILSHDFHLARVKLTADRLDIPVQRLLPALQDEPDSSARITREYLAYLWYWVDSMINR